jgi:hypothetical protein
MSSGAFSTFILRLINTIDASLVRAQLERSEQRGDALQQQLDAVQVRNMPQRRSAYARKHFDQGIYAWV